MLGSRIQIYNIVTYMICVLRCHVHINVVRSREPAAQRPELKIYYRISFEFIQQIFLLFILARQHRND